MGILSSHSPLRTAATGFLQSCIFLNLFLIEQKCIMVNLSPFWRGSHTEDCSLCTYLRARKWGAPLEFPEASIPRGWKVNCTGLSEPEPNQLITSPSNSPFLFPSFSIILLLTSLFPPPSAFPFFLLFPLSLSQREARECQKLPSTAAVWRGRWLPKWSDLVAYLPEKSSFPLLWPRLLSDPGAAVSGVGLPSSHYQGGRGRM